MYKWDYVIIYILYVLKPDKTPKSLVKYLFDQKNLPTSPWFNFYNTTQS